MRAWFKNIWTNSATLQYIAFVSKMYVTIGTMLSQLIIHSKSLIATVVSYKLYCQILINAYCQDFCQLACCKTHYNHVYGFSFSHIKGDHCLNTNLLYQRNFILSITHMYVCTYLVFWSIILSIDLLASNRDINIKHYINIQCKMLACNDSNQLACI